MPSQLISEELAKILTQNYRDFNEIKESRGYSFRRTEIEAILNSPGCTGIRIYFGQHNNGDEALVLVGITGTINDDGQAESAINDIHAGNNASPKFAEYGISTSIAPDEDNSPIFKTQGT